MDAAEFASEAGIRQAFGCTFGIYNQTVPWSDIRHLTWEELAGLFTSHALGIKEGSCIVPAVFAGGKRTKAEAMQIDVALLDSDAGSPLTEIRTAIEGLGIRAIVASTHSHMVTHTRVSRKNWEKYCSSATAPTPENFLTTAKSYRPQVAAGATVNQSDDDYVHIRHNPCPKFRIAIPLQKSWVSASYPDQDAANAAWKERIEALAAVLGLDHDQACTDTSRLFYLPRRPPTGAPPETAVLDGDLCDIFALPSANKKSWTRPYGGAKGRSAPVEFVDPETGEVFDLREWARAHADRFEIVSALRARKPDVLLNRIADSTKHHIRCVNEIAHTQAGADSATIIINASASQTGGFVYHCRHAHCDGQDRLFFLQKLLIEKWLHISDLADAEYLEPDKNPESQKGDPVELTEHGVALAFAKQRVDTLRYCHSSGSWYVWTGTHWAKNETKLAFDWARRLVASLNRGQTLKIRAATGRAAFAKAVEQFAQADPVLAVTAELWNPDPMLLGTPAGVVNLTTGRLHPARREDLITQITAVAPAAKANCPKFLAFLHQTTGGDEDLICFLQRWFGYCLTGSTQEHALIFIYGPGGNGKSVLLGTISSILADYATTAAPDTFTTVRGERHPTDLAMLHGPRLVLSTETEEGRAWAEAKIKAATGGDRITARFMRRDFFTYTPAFKLTISGNHKPTLNNVDEAARRRFNVISFMHKPDKPNRHLIDELREEWPGILRWMIDGCLAWQHLGLQQPALVFWSTDAYFTEQDLVAQWIEECCEIGSQLGTANGVLFASWQDYSEVRGEQARTSRWLSSTLEQRGYLRDKDCELFRGRGFRGLRVRLISQPRPRKSGT